MYSEERLLSKKKEIDFQISIELCPNSIIEEIQWFSFQGIMLHKADNIKSSEEHLQLLLRIFSILRIRIWYDESIGYKYVTEAIVRMCINCGKVLVVS